MPPLNGIDRGINGNLLKALEEIGHGAQIAVVDASYDIPPAAEVADYQGDSSARALKGILDLVPLDDANGYPNVSVMVPHFPQEPGTALEAFEEALTVEPGLTGQRDFYTLANNPEKHTLFVRTRDEKAFACALFVVGHSQE
ncbi:MAG TPA: RbsD/FucU domain-containing protein [Verrucomicrobiae bacterium]|nr:RbsD/FucU domain-containing protein [Verrucomicrobiae bacterium]